MVYGHTNAPYEYNISIDNIKIEQINCIKFLGVYFIVNSHGLNMRILYILKLQRIFQ